jgi:hypothetical protein
MKAALATFIHIIFLVDAELTWLYHIIYITWEAAMESTRALITLPTEDKKWLKDYSRSHGISLAEAVRQGIHCLKKSEYKNLYYSLIERTRGIWSKGDGLKYQRNIRSEWNDA